MTVFIWVKIFFIALYLSFRFFDVRSVAPRDLGVNRKLSTLHNFVSVFNA